MGFDEDIDRWTTFPPLQDSLIPDNLDVYRSKYGPDWLVELEFGSAHNNGFHMAFCDGSVQTINYGIDPKIHYRLGNRNHNGPIDSKSF